MKNLREKKEEVRAEGSVTTKIKVKAKEIGKFLYQQRNIIAVVIMVVMIIAPSLVFAASTDAASAEGAAGDNQWNFLTSLIIKWGKRIGGAIMLFGGIEFGIGWKDDRADQRTQGLRIAVAGGIVLGVVSASGTFLA